MKKIFFEIVSSLRSKEIKIHATSLWMQMGAVLLNLFTNLLLAKIMLPGDYGAFAYSSTLIFVLAGLGSFGTLNVLVREVSAARTQNNLSLSNNLLFWSTKRSIFFLFLTLSVFIFTSLQFNLFFGTASMAPYRYPILISLLSVPLLTHIYISQSYLQGLSKIFSAQFAEKLLKPFVFLVLAALIYFLQKNIPLSFSTVALINPLSFLIALIAIFLSVRKSIAPINSSLVERNIYNKWKKSSLTFFFFNAVTLIFLRTDMLTLGFFENTEQIGIYNISCRVADIVSFPLHIISFGLAPLISGFFLSGDKKKLQQTVTASVRIIFFLSVIPAIILFFFGDEVLNLFGKHFEAGNSTLMILIFGNMFNVIAGPAGYVLTMTGHERLAFIAMSISCVLNITLNLILIPAYGITGAAIAVSIALLAWNVLITIFTIKKTGIRPDIFCLTKGNEI